MRRLGEMAEVPRFVFEIVLSKVWAAGFTKGHAVGDGHSILVIPGMLGSDRYNRSLIHWLRASGFDAHGWGLGVNLGPRPELAQGMADRLDRLYASQNRKVTIIGHSLGGIYARELARAMPEKVRGVISLGSPIAGETGFGEHLPARVFDYLNSYHAPPSARALNPDAPPVPCTAVCSKTDVIVHWKKSIQITSHAQCENVIVTSSHSGMTNSPVVWAVIINRLSQPENDWQPLTAGRLASYFYRALK